MKTFKTLSSKLSMRTMAFAVALVAALGIGVAHASDALNSSGNHTFASASIADPTGVVTTVATAGTYVTVGTAAPLVVDAADLSSCITYALGTNKFTVARCGQGQLRLEACLNDVVSNNGQFFLGAWHRVRAGSTTQVGPVLRQTELAAATRNSRGCLVANVTALSGDTYDFRYDVQTNANTVTTRAATFVVEKKTNS